MKHNFNLCYRDDPTHRVTSFTAAQIPEIAGRRYPPDLAGRLYPEGIPIRDEAGLSSWPTATSAKGRSCTRHPSPSAADAAIRQVMDNIRRINPRAAIVRGTSPVVVVDDPASIRG